MSPQATYISYALEFYHVTFLFSLDNIFKMIKTIFLAHFNESNALPGLKKLTYFGAPRERAMSL